MRRCGADRAMRALLPARTIILLCVFTELPRGANPSDRPIP